MDVITKFNQLKTLPFTLTEAFPFPLTENESLLLNQLSAEIRTLIRCEIEKSHFSDSVILMDGEEKNYIMDLLKIDEEITNLLNRKFDAGNPN